MEKVGLELIEEMSSKVDEVQRRVLAEILSENANVEYLQRNGLNGHTDRESFKKYIPVITYEDIEADIDRIANGDKSQILISKPVIEFFESSGTSGGKNKLIPQADEALGRRSQLHKLKSCVISQFDPDHGKGIGMYFMFIASEYKTPGGVPVRTVSTSFLKRHYSACMEKDTSSTAPILCLDPYQTTYSQLLCGLSQNKQVLRVGSHFASGFIRGINFLEQHWTLLCNDIRTGTISTTHITDPLVREQVMKILKPDPELADFIEAECRKVSWRGIVSRLWPNTKYVDTIVTGSMSQYIPTLEYYTNNLPLVSKMYGSTECSFGLNLNPFCNPNEIAYTLIPTMCYFEFLPYHRNGGIIDSIISMSKSPDENEQEQLVDLADVEIGKDYELVITTYCGLYRYRVGDVLRVAGFNNKAPQFSFLCRKNVILSIDYDKTDEAELQNAVKNASTHLLPFDAHVTEYTSYVSIASQSHYVLFWELNAHALTIPPSVFADCCLTIEESLNYNYRHARFSDKYIAPLEIRIVETGSFNKLMDYCINTIGASMSQYKTPRCLKNASLVELLNSMVLSTNFSPMCP